MIAKELDRLVYTKRNSPVLSLGKVEFKIKNTEQHKEEHIMIKMNHL